MTQYLIEVPNDIGLAIYRPVRSLDILRFEEVSLSPQRGSSVDGVVMPGGY